LGDLGEKGSELGEGGFAKISPFREHGNVNKGEGMRERVNGIFLIR
jgi:hypothetical protein